MLLVLEIGCTFQINQFSNLICTIFIFKVINDSGKNIIDYYGNNYLKYQFGIY